MRDSRKDIYNEMQHHYYCSGAIDQQLYYKEYLANANRWADWWYIPRTAEDITIMESLQKDNITDVRPLVLKLKPSPTYI